MVVFLRCNNYIHIPHSLRFYRNNKIGSNQIDGKAAGRHNQQGGRVIFL